MQNTPLFRQDLAGPYGSNGLHEKFEGISNASYTTNLDPTTLATPEGRELLMNLAGKDGEELHENYVAILKETGVTGYPFVNATNGHKVGQRDTPVGRQVDKQKLLDMKAYCFSLPAPKGFKVDAEMAARGRKLFEASCTQCHNADQSKPVPAKLIALKELWPAYAPAILAKRKLPLSPVEDSPGGYDDKMVVIDASERGEKRGIPLPLLLDLTRKNTFLHDDSVPGLDALLNPERGEKEPHPFYLKDKAQRADMVAFLTGLDIGEAALGEKDDAPTKTDVVYVVSNDPVKGGNAVLAYLSDGRGNLTHLPGSPFKTGGTGYATKYNLPHFGPFDLDQNIIANPERSRLFVTNGGSDTVAVFDVQADGGLKPVTGSPFPSGGKNPVSLGLVGDRLYVVNKNEDPGRDMTKTLPNYAGFRVGEDGSLTPIPKSVFELPTASRSPTQALVVEGKFLFDGDFGSFPLPSRVEMWGKGLLKDSASLIRSFKINSDGTLHQHPPVLAPEGEFDGGMDVDGDGNADPLIFGLQVHPKKKLIYIGFVTAAKIGVYRYDDEGRLTFVRSVPNKGKLVCWIKINKAGTRAYTTNNADDTVSVYDLSDAESPKEIQTLQLKGHGHPYQFALSPDERSLYVVKHRTFNETPLGDGSVLNVLTVGHDGMLEETDSSPVILPVQNDLLARPQGVLVIPQSGPGLGDPAGDIASELPAIKQPGPAPRELPRVPPPDAKAAEVPEGYRVEVILTDLEYPSSIEFDDQGALYVAEAGNIDGAWVARARILKFTWPSPQDRRTEVVADQLSGPVTDILWHTGRLYISHRGKISVLEKGKVRDLVTDLPSFGDHHNNQMSVGPDGKIYFGQGSATNSGVVSVDNFLLGWLSPHPDFCDRPGKDITLRGQAFESADPLTALAKNKARTVQTSAFQSFGKTVPEGTMVKGTNRATAAIMRMDADGSNLEVYAWGLRNPFGVMWGPDKKLYASDNGADERGSRPIANAPDNLWLIKEGGWYGWPDFVSGIPVTDERFKPKNAPAPEFLLKEHPKVEKPLMTFEPHTSVTTIAFSRSPKFGFEGHLFLAASGDYSPATATEQKRVGYWVKRIDLDTGKAHDFLRTRPDALGPKDLEYVMTAGPRRPVGLRFSPQGDALYVVDIGAVVFMRSGTGPTPRPYPGTGVVWRITRAGP